ncbi:MAG: transporter substrate-binding domain-containing protein, partial [Verrucomicrobiota bacterium]|nr:transporter substrate-binding domain-containing protein [Verrucomicrobiota bacterium]
TGLFRRDKYEPLGLVASTIKNQGDRIGFVKNTTGEYYCIQRFTRAKLVGYSTAADAVAALQGKKIDMFVHDAPVVWWLSSLNERDLVAFPEALSIEPVAWGVGKHNMVLLDEANALLAQWEKDGTSKKILGNWIPRFGK